MPDEGFDKNNPTCKNCMLYCFCSAPMDYQALSAQLLVRKKHKLKHKELLYSYRDQFANVYAVKAGGLKTYHVDADGQERIHQFYLAGEILGFEAIYTDYYPFSAIAIASDTVVCEIPYESLLGYVYSYPELHRKILYFMSQRYTFGLYITAPSAEQRLAAFLLELSGRLHAQEQRQEFSLSMSRQDIGNYLGLAAETVSRLFTRLQQSNIISANNRKIKILEMRKLQWLAQDRLPSLPPHKALIS